MLEGTKVRIVMARNDVFDFQTSCEFPATYIQGPRGDGDLIHVEVEGRELRFNGISPEFVAMIEEASDE